MLYWLDSSWRNKRTLSVDILLISKFHKKHKDRPIKSNPFLKLEKTYVAALPS